MTRTYLSEAFPSLLKEWDYHRNQALGISPKNLSYGSGKRVWWVCSRGHSWLVSVNTRTALGRGCPYCSNQKAGHGNDLLTNFPELSEEWDFDKNSVRPNEVLPGANKRVWWLCDEGHSFEMSPNKRTGRGSGCPYCTGHRVGQGNDLLSLFPELCEEWDYDNNILDPSEITPGSNKKSWWLCDKGHSWDTKVNQKVSGCRCPYCFGKRVGYGNDLLTKFPELCKEWDRTKNSYGPDEITPGSNKKVYWRCEKGHSWKAFINNRTKPTRPAGCPYCQGTVSPMFYDIVEEFFSAGYFVVSSSYENCRSKLRYVCDVGHVNITSLGKFRAGRRCPSCAGNKRKSLFDIIKLCDKSVFTLVSIKYSNSRAPIKVVCDLGHVVETTVDSLVSGRGCRECAHNRQKTYDEVSKDFFSAGIKVLSTSYYKCSGPLECECTSGHRISLSWNSFREGSRCPHCSKRVSSVSTKWLDELGINEREVRIVVEDRVFYVDGFDPETNTVYEFLGDYWHGNPDKYSRELINPSTGSSYGALFDKTIDKIKALSSKYNVKYIWENEYRNR